MKKPVFTVILVGLMSFGASASQQLVDHDYSVSTLHATELRKQALNESVSTVHATKLRLKSSEGASFSMAQVGRTGGYDFSYDSVTGDANSHYRNHR
ncbi:hypothetical protein ACFL53_00780 [Pseudomonadota bacterium]